MPTFERATQNAGFISSLCDQPPPPGHFTGEHTKNGVRVLRSVPKERTNPSTTKKQHKSPAYSRWLERCERREKREKRRLSRTT